MSCLQHKVASTTLLPAHAAGRLEGTLLGVESIPSLPLSTEGQAHRLIAEATDHEKLGQVRCPEFSSGASTKPGCPLPVSGGSWTADVCVVAACDRAGPLVEALADNLEMAGLLLKALALSQSIYLTAAIFCTACPAVIAIIPCPTADIAGLVSRG